MLKSCYYYNYYYCYCYYCCYYYNILCRTFQFSLIFLSIHSKSKIHIFCPDLKIGMSESHLSWLWQPYVFSHSLLELLTVYFLFTSCVFLFLYFIAINKNCEISDIFQPQIHTKLKSHTLRWCDDVLMFYSLFKLTLTGAKLPQSSLQRSRFNGSSHISGSQVMCLHASVCLSSGSVTVAHGKRIRG